jgi:hypothetical protein
MTQEQDPRPYRRERGPSRRRFLYGAGGVVMALPLLEGLSLTSGRGDLHANPNNKPVYFVAMRGGNGVAQQYNAEPERFWPVERGALTRELLLRSDATGQRAIAELADWASKLLIVDGCKYSFPGNGCGHSGGGNQCLTAAPPSAMPAGNRSLAMGESLDSLIERTLNPMRPEPLTLMGGRTSSYLNEVLSFAPPLAGETNGRLRSAQRNPWEVYLSLFGDPATSANDVLHNQIALQRRSVNDLMREQLDRIERSPRLSQADRARLDLHKQSIRDLEARMLACHLHETDWGPIKQAGDSGAWRNDSTAEQMLRMMMEITALAFACDLKRSATIQVGNGNDQTIYDVGGPRYPFHWISHRIQGDGDTGDAIPDAALLHHRVDRIHLRWFRYLIERLNEYNTEQGTLLDDTIALWTNDLANGPPHGYRNLPMIIAGSGGGYLRQGVYIDARETGQRASDNWVPHNQLFNTVLNAVGIRKADGSPVDDFGHKGGNGHDRPRGGEIAGMKAQG